MKQLFLLGFLALSTALSAQLNTTLRSNLPYDDSVNDVWGYVAPDGTEYAIVGLLNGVSFVSLADPDNAVEVVRIPGVRSAWRDMKTYRTYAYSVADQQNEGITAFDLSFLPDSVPIKRTTYEIEGYPTPFVRAHNVYIDTATARLFTAGGDRRTSVGFGRTIAFDLAEDPMEPKLIALGPDTYAHDVYVQGDTMYASEIYQGELAIYDISDLENITEIGTTRTPFTFTHNAWSTADGLTVFTTDEEPNAPVAAYDISDPNDIELIDEYRPLSSLNTGTIPHNVHVIDNYLSISYYTDGLRVVDAIEPDNLIEVANYDTWLGLNGDFNGNWGAYPYLPSGLTLISDRSTGLYVVDVDYKRAARLRGIITDVDFGFPINNVEVTVDALEPADTGTDALGRYRTGVATGGSYQVTFTADNYLPLKVNVDFANGETVVLDTTLSPTIRRFLNQEITVIDDETEAPISNAIVRVFNEDFEYIEAASSDGKASFEFINEGIYDGYVTEWGYETVELPITNIEDGLPTVIRLRRGYMDDFVTDEGWTESGDARVGQWERGVPIGTNFGGVFAPDSDASDDFGRQAYVTGNGGGGGAGGNDVDGGMTLLTSPEFGVLDGEDDPVVHYQYWFANGSGDAPLDDTLRVSITDGTTTILVRKYGERTTEWMTDSIRVADFLTATDGLQLIVSTGDTDSTGHLVEAGFDNFRVTATPWATSTDDFGFSDLEVDVFPNPSDAAFTLRYDLPEARSPRLHVTDAAGRIIQQQSLNTASGTFRFGENLPQGFYFLSLHDGKRQLWVAKLVKD